MQADGDDVIETGDERTPETGAKVESNAHPSRREADSKRRALIQAGWAVPAILAVGLTHEAKAQSGYFGGTPLPPPPELGPDT
jgi:hypothetical protein